MPINLNEAIQKIKTVGPSNVRVIPMPGQNMMTGNYQIEVQDNGSWSSIVVGIKKAMAEDIVSQATNRVILG
jgi:hypothetical protein